MIISLNDAEKKLAQYLAKRRFEMNRSCGVKDAKVGPQSNEETDLEGIAAEIAFCKANNIYPDLTIDNKSSADCVLSNGLSVDVKATKYKNGHLLATARKAEIKRPDIYALVVGEFPNYRIAGVMSAEELLKEERLKSFGYAPTYAASQSELKPL